MTLSFQTRFEQLGDLRYAVHEAGPAEATPMLLLHGLMDTGTSFAALAEQIERRLPGSFRFIAPDWRGHGASDAIADTYWFPEYLVDLDRLLDRLQPSNADTTEPVVLVGHSMGGQIAAQYAGVRPECVSHLVILDSLNVPDADVEKTPERYRRWLDAKDRPTAERSYDDTQAIAARIGKRYPELSRKQLHDIAERWSETVDGGPQRRMRHDPWHRVTFPYGFRADEAMAIWRQTTAAVLCIDAADSFMRHVTDAEAMTRRRACFTRVHHVVVEDSGHMIHIQQPERLAEEISAFVRPASTANSD